METIYGRNPVVEVLKGNNPIERVYIQDTLSGEFEKEIRALCRSKNVPLNRVPKSRLDVAIRGNHQGIYALASIINYADLESLIIDLTKENKVPLFLILDSIQDVRNIGAIARSAEIFGAHAIILSSKKTAPISETAIKVSAGALTHLPVCKVKNLGAAMDVLCRNNIEIIGADNNGTSSITDMNFKKPVAIVLGAEGKGIDRNLKIYFDHHFHIPQSGKIDSLNVAVAAGIVLYEVHKQRL